MNATLKAEIYTLQKSFTGLPKIEIMKDIEAGDDCDWIQVRFDDTSKGHLFMSNPYPCRYVVLYPPDRLHFNKRTKNLEAVFFTSECITSIVNQMIHEYENPPKPISLGSNFHRSLLKTKQARSLYEQLVEQTHRRGDHDGVYRLTFTDRKTAKEDYISAHRAFTFDHIEVFGLTKLPRTVISDNTITTTGRPLSAAAKIRAQNDLDNCVKRLLEDTTGKPDIQKARLIYDRIVEMRNYNAEDPDDFEMIGPVQNGRGCCSGYSKLMRYAFEKASIPCVIVYSESHAWNLAILNGKLLSFDVTWESKEGPHRFFALSVDEMSKKPNHTMDDIFFKEVA